MCPDGRTECPLGGTCCPGLDGGYGCAPAEANAPTRHGWPAGPATCCADKVHACAHGYTCGAGRCKNPNGSVPHPGLSADWPVPMGMQDWQPLWTLCRGPGGLLPRQALPFTVNGSAGGSSVLTFPYYSTHGALGQPSPAAADVKVALIAQHGAARNGDDYFCAGAQAARMQSVFDPREVLVIGPHFMQNGAGHADFGAAFGGDGGQHRQGSAPSGSPWPDDVTAPSDSDGALWWNGSFVQGYWRAGGDSDPRADTSGRGGVVSAFAVLDEMVRLLLHSGAYPNLQRVVLAGHSAGGQIVQRHAIFTKVPPGAQPTAHGATGRSVGVHHVVSNPSSFGYLDGRRCLPTEVAGPSPLTAASALGVPPAAAAQCAGYDSWHFGLAANLVPYAAARAAERGGGGGPEGVAAGLAAVAADYGRRSIAYLQGGNDTCNEKLVPACASHGLETTCADMYGGGFRVQRGAKFFEYLQRLFPREEGAAGANTNANATTTHSLVFVDGVGHDHSMLWHSPEGLRALFGETAAL